MRPPCAPSVSPLRGLPPPQRRGGGAAARQRRDGGAL